MQTDVCEQDRTLERTGGKDALILGPPPHGSPIGLRSVGVSAAEALPAIYEILGWHVLLPGYRALGESGVGIDQWKGRNAGGEHAATSKKLSARESIRHEASSLSS